MEKSRVCYSLSAGAWGRESRGAAGEEGRHGWDVGLHPLSTASVLGTAPGASTRGGAPGRKMNRRWLLLHEEEGAGGAAPWLLGAAGKISGRHEQRGSVVCVWGRRKKAVAARGEIENFQFARERATIYRRKPRVRVSNGLG
jgi:hypothetical protein